MNPSEMQLQHGLDSAPDDWSMRLQLAEKLADRWAGQEMDLLLAAAPNAPGTEEEMRKLVDLANAHCPGYRGLKHVLDLFLQTHLTSSWAHFIHAQALFYSGEEEAALRHYQTSKSLNPSRRDEELEKHLEARSRAGAETAPRTSAETFTIIPVPARKEIQESPRVDTQSADAVGPVLEEEAPEDSTTADPAESSAGADETTDSGNSDADGEPPVFESADHEVGKEAAPVEATSEPAEPDPGISGPADRRGTHSSEVNPDSPIHLESLSENGELLSAHKKEDDSREKLSALSIAVIIHVVAMLVFAFWHVVNAPKSPPQFISSVISTGDEKQAQRPEIKKYQRPQMPAATARMTVMTAPAVSAVAMPEMNQSVATFDPVGTGDTFGLGMSFAGGGGGAVSFFGSKSTSKKVVFVVDVSASMGGSKDELMRKELTRSIESLPASVEYAVIFFGGPAWYAGQKPGEAGLEGQWEANVVQDGSRRYVWYEGWSEKERHGGNRTSALYHYSMGEQNLPAGQYRKATKSNIRQTVEHIQQTPLVFGTDWRWGLKMAMNMKPDNIFFMTDGAFGTGPGVTKEEMIQDLLEYNRRRGNARINTICMMVLLARQELEQLAMGSKGEFSLVLQDGSVVRGSDFENR